MKYKVGDKVRIQNKEWYDKHKDECGNVKGAFFDKGKAKLCGTIQTIANSGYVDGSGIIIYAIEDAYEFIGEEAIEGLAEDTKKSPVELLAELWNKADREMQDKYDKTKRMLENWEHGFPCPEGYIFKDENGNVIEAKKIVLEKKKPKYPQSYEECCKVLMGKTDFADFELVLTKLSISTKYENTISPEPSHIKEINALYKLIICRNAYWKLAGNWKPDYDSGVDKFGIFNFEGVIQKSCTSSSWERHINKILDFPTAEMRDAFYENFKDLIEECKELL